MAASSSRAKRRPSPSRDRGGGLRLESGEPKQDAPVVGAERHLRPLAGGQQQVRRAVVQGRSPGLVRPVHRPYGWRGECLALALERSVIIHWVGHWIQSLISWSRPAPGSRPGRAGRGYGVLRGMPKARRAAALWVALTAEIRRGT